MQFASPKSKFPAENGGLESKSSSRINDFETFWIEKFFCNDFRAKVSTFRNKRAL